MEVIKVSNELQLHVNKSRRTLINKSGCPLFQYVTFYPKVHQLKLDSYISGVNKLPFSSDLVGEKLLKIGLWGGIT